MDSFDKILDFSEIYNNKKKGFIVDENVLKSWKDKQELGIPVKDFALFSFNSLEDARDNLKLVLDVLDKKNKEDVNLDNHNRKGYFNLIEIKLYSVDYSILFDPIIGADFDVVYNEDYLFKSEHSGLTISLYEFLVNYELGFTEGILEFQKKYGPKPKDFFGPKMMETVEYLKHLYFNTNTNHIMKGFSYVKTNTWKRCSPELMRTDGFYAGLTFSIDKLVSEYQVEGFYDSGDTQGKSLKGYPYPSIFKNETAYRIFNKLHDNYKSAMDTATANYSFVYYAMKKDELIICRGVDFIGFLSRLDDPIVIDRIDSRQAGENQRTLYYDSVKSAILA